MYLETDIAMYLTVRVVRRTGYLDGELRYLGGQVGKWRVERIGGEVYGRQFV